MKKILSLFITFLFFYFGYCQVDPGNDLTAKDSLQILDDLKKLLDSTEAPTSYFQVSVGVGTRLYSENNNSINAKQSINNTIIYTSQLGYYHKSGFSLGVGANYLTESNSSFSANQFSISPAYDLLNNKTINAGISYTHYFVSNKFSPYSSPIQNDLYGYITYKKVWLQPGISLGFSAGEYKQVKRADTAIAGIRRRLYDSATFRLKAFTMIPTVSHSFEWEKIIDKTDRFSFVPTLMLNLGSSKTTISHKTNVPAGVINFLNKKGKIPKLQENKFQAESVGLSLDVGYEIGRFSFSPQAYFDYYLQNTDENKFTSNFSFVIGLSF